MPYHYRHVILPKLDESSMKKGVASNNTCIFLVLSTDPKLIPVYVPRPFVKSTGINFGPVLHRVTTRNRRTGIEYSSILVL